MPLLALDAPSSAVTTMSRHRRPPRGTPSGAQVEGLTTEYPKSVLAGRRSVRRFGDRTVPVEELTDVLGTAEGAQRRQWPAGRHGDPGLTLMAAAYRVDGLPGALHVWCRETAAFDPGGNPEWLRRLPAWFAAAPALVLVCGSINRADRIAYGQLLVQAGALGYEIWLAARSRGLECSVYGNAIHEASGALAPGGRHLFTVALGYAVEV
ncbi:nitroreductase family protein [Nonomuraea sp. LPB2021202275-12-8]|uniref:nitroreductase family protein n=1 Tax=Nonomuraea sp. LPB2021202275-12-8 TaxID=3120159 RepID=UPI00300D19BA